MRESEIKKMIERIEGEEEEREGEEEDTNYNALDSP